MHVCVYIIIYVLFIYIYIYIDIDIDTKMWYPWFGVFDLYFPVLCASLILGLCFKIRGVPYVYMICMHAYICDKSNDISICNLNSLNASKIQDSRI